MGGGFSTVGNTFSTVEIVQFSGDNLSTVRGSFSTVEGIQYIGGYLPYRQEDNISTVGGGGGAFSTVKGIQYSGGYLKYRGVSFSTVGDNISTVQVIQYSGDKDLKCYEFPKNLEIFSRAYFALQSD